MPYSDRQLLLRRLHESLHLLALQSASPETDPEILYLMDMLEIVESRRYLERVRIPEEQRTGRYQEVIPMRFCMPDVDFIKMFRLSKNQFEAVVEKVSDHPIFISAGRKPQAPVAFQLLVALWRFTHNGTGTNVFEVADRFGCSGKSTS